MKLVRVFGVLVEKLNRLSLVFFLNRDEVF